MNLSRFINALGANLVLILGLLVGYFVLVVASVLLKTARPAVPPVDVVFVFDTTSSMQDKIDALKHISSRFAGELANSGSDYRVGMVCFGALEETQVIRDTIALDNNLPAFQQFLTQLHDHGGGREDQPTAMTYAFHEFHYRPHARKILILVSDEPVYGNETGGNDPEGLRRWTAVVDQAVKEQYTAYAVTCAYEPYQELAQKTGGKFYDITFNRDFSGMLLDIAHSINASLMN